MRRAIWFRRPARIVVVRGGWRNDHRFCRARAGNQRRSCACAAFYDAFLPAWIQAGQPEALFVLLLFSGAAGEARDAGIVCAGGRWRIGSCEQAWGHVPVLTCVGDNRDCLLVTHVERGFDFLGQNVRRYPNGKLLIKPSKKNVGTFLDSIRRIIKDAHGVSAADLIDQLNPKIRSWANYQRHVVSKRTFGRVDLLCPPRDGRFHWCHELRFASSRVP